MTEHRANITESLKTLKAAKGWLVFKIFFFVVSAFSALSAWVYIGNVEGKNTAERLSADFTTFTETQMHWMETALTLEQSLLDKNTTNAFEQMPLDLRSHAQATLIALGSVRVPTGKLERARSDYKNALEDLIGVSNRLIRDPGRVTANELHNALQLASNKAGEFRMAVDHFQGGALQQILGSIM